MTSAQTAWAILIAAQAVVNAPFLFHLLKGPPMPVSDKISASLAQIQTSVAAIPALTADAVKAAQAQAAQDQADTEVAVQAAADTLKQAVGT